MSPLTKTGILFMLLMAGLSCKSPNGPNSQNNTEECETVDGVGGAFIRSAILIVDKEAGNDTIEMTPATQNNRAQRNRCSRNVRVDFDGSYLFIANLRDTGTYTLGDLKGTHEKPTGNVFAYREWRSGESSVYWDTHDSYPGICKITRLDLDSFIIEGSIITDVFRDSTFERAHVSGSFRMPIQTPGGVH